MKLLVDAQLPRQVARLLHDLGHDAIHTLDLPQANRTPDSEIIAISLQQERIVVTKDSDFVDSFIIHGEPKKLLLVSTGNIPNVHLTALFRSHLLQICQAFETMAFIEITRTGTVYHG